MPPCIFCEKLTEEETDILITHGLDSLVAFWKGENDKPEKRERPWWF